MKCVLALLQPPSSWLKAPYQARFLQAPVLALQMPGTFLPLVLLPGVCFVNFPFDLTLEGQYIVKNLALVGAGLVVGSRLIPLKTTVKQKG